jgi:hypothetical protein
MSDAVLIYQIQANKKPKLFGFGLYKIKIWVIQRQLQELR